MESVTFTSEELERLNRYSESVYKERGILLHLASVCGLRWSYIAGYRPAENSIFSSLREEISPGAGVVIYFSGRVDPVEKEEIIRNVRDIFGLPSCFEHQARPKERLSRDRIIHYFKTDDEAEISALFEQADRAREVYAGNEVHLRALIEASNICSKNCLYCGLRRDNRKVKRYKLSGEEIFLSARRAAELGYKTVVIQTGESPVYPVFELCGLIKKIKKNLDLAITLSLGELNFDEYAALRDAGADRYLMRFETSDENLFRRLKPDSDFSARIKRIEWLRRLGYQIGSGIMIGLPGQGFESLADDILLFDELKLDMVGSGPFIANPDTPLVNSAGASLTASLKLIALTRLVTLDAHIPATTALGSIDPLGRQRGLRCGANVIMPNCTPKKYRKDYLLYPGKICVKEEPSDCVSCVKAMVESCGRVISSGYGHSLKKREGA